LHNYVISCWLLYFVIYVIIYFNFQDRLNKVHDQAVKEASRRKPLIEPSPVASSARSSIESPEPDPPDNQNPSSSSSSTNIVKEVAEAKADATS
jgi:cytoskeletal protein RodZ